VAGREAGPRHRRSHSGIAALAEPPQIGRGVVRLVAVAVIDHQEAGGTTDFAAARARRHTPLGTMPLRPISDAVGGLAT